MVFWIVQTKEMLFWSSQAPFFFRALRHYKNIVLEFSDFAEVVVWSCQSGEMQSCCGAIKQRKNSFGELSVGTNIMFCITQTARISILESSDIPTRVLCCTRTLQE